MLEHLSGERPFVTAESEDADSPRGRLLIAICGSGNYLAVVERYRARLTKEDLESIHEIGVRYQ